MYMGHTDPSSGDSAEELLFKHGSGEWRRLYTISELVVKLYVKGSKAKVQQFESK